MPWVSSLENVAMKREPTFLCWTEGNLPWWLVYVACVFLTGYIWIKRCVCSCCYPWPVIFFLRSGGHLYMIRSDGSGIGCFYSNCQLGVRLPVVSTGPCRMFPILARASSSSRLNKNKHWWVQPRINRKDFFSLPRAYLGEENRTWLATSKRTSFSWNLTWESITGVQSQGIGVGIWLPVCLHSRAGCLACAVLAGKSAVGREEIASAEVLLIYGSSACLFLGLASWL